jgi:hypothetical protein
MPWTSARSSGAHAQRWRARHGAPPIRDPTLHLTTETRPARLRCPSHASRPNRRWPLDKHSVSRMSPTCGRRSHLGRLALFPPEPRLWPLLLPSSSSPYLSSPSAPGRAQSKLQSDFGKTRSQEWRSGFLIASELPIGRPNGQANSQVRAWDAFCNHRSKVSEVMVRIRTQRKTKDDVS